MAIIGANKIGSFIGKTQFNKTDFRQPTGNDIDELFLQLDNYRLNLESMQNAQTIGNENKIRLLKNTF